MEAEQFNISLSTSSEAETIDVARRVASLLRRGDVVALYGDLGAGKTRFVRGLVEALGIDPSKVASPTFVLLHEYSTNDADGMTLVHIDAFRLSSANELEAIGWDEIIQARDSIVAIEWAERVAKALPVDRIDIEIDYGEGNMRSIRIALRGACVDDDRDWNSIREKSLPKQSNCIICGRQTSTDSEFFPFCSSRCRLVDLGRWLGGKYTLSREIRHDDEVL